MLLCFHTFHVQEVSFFYSSQAEFDLCSQRSTFLHTRPISLVLTTSLPFADASNPYINLHIQLLSFSVKSIAAAAAPSSSYSYFAVQNTEAVGLIELQQF